MIQRHKEAGFTLFDVITAASSFKFWFLYEEMYDLLNCEN